jgi:hypothetical protein
LIATERKSQAQLKADTGIWIEQFLTVGMSTQPGDMMMTPALGNPTPGNPTPGYPPAGTPPGYPGAGNPEVDRATRPHYPTDNAGAPPTPPPGTTPPPGEVLSPNQVPDLAPVSTNQIGSFKILCRAVDLSSVQADSSSTIVTIFESELRASPMFDAAGTHVTSNIMPDDTTHYTFTVSLLVALKRPLKL